MTLAQITIFLYLIVYLLVSSQVLFYWLVLSDAMKKISMVNFISIRKEIDKLAEVRLRILYYSSLLIGLITVVVTWNYSNTAFFITCVVSFLCLLVDVAIAMRGNVPLNKVISSYINGNEHENWEMVRTQWIRYINLRAMFIGFGMTALLAALIIG